MRAWQVTPCNMDEEETQVALTQHTTESQEQVELPDEGVNESDVGDDSGDDSDNESGSACKVEPHSNTFIEQDGADELEGVPTAEEPPKDPKVQGLPKAEEPPEDPKVKGLPKAEEPPEEPQVQGLPKAEEPPEDFKEEPKVEEAKGEEPKDPAIDLDSDDDKKGVHKAR